jgi:glycosyltransferase involved in cell wall biosynthesis
MNIVFCISSLGSGGAERALSDLANHYVGKGHAVYLLTLVSSDTKPFYPIDSRITLIQTNKSSRGKVSILRRIYNVLRSLFEMRKKIKQLNADVVVSFIDLMNVRALLACCGLGIPVIVSERTDPAYHQLPLKILSEWLRLKLYPYAYRLVVQTKSAANYFPSAWYDKITIIPNVVKRPDKIKKMGSHHIKNIITVGRLSEEKNHKDLILAFYDWIKHYPNLTLKIYGEGSERENLEKLIIDLSLQNNVKLAGVTKDIQAAMFDSDLFVFPSRYEGFPNALCEAMAVGLPVVASNCSGNSEVIEDGFNGVLYPVGDRDELTKSVLGLLNNSKKCQYISENSCKVVECFGEDKVYKFWDSHILSCQ